MQTKHVLNERVNIEVKDNEINSDWHLSRLAHELYWWYDFINILFFKEEPVPVPVISFEKTSVKTLGHFVIGKNAIGLSNNINVNRIYLHRPLWEVIATLTHELCHSWQQTYGKLESRNWYHGKEFQQKMLEIGIVTNNKGQHLAVSDPFVYLLRRHGVNVCIEPNIEGILEIDTEPKKKGKSKLKKWSCGCTNIRVAITDFKAICLKCENEFELVE